MKNFFFTFSIRVGHKTGLMKAATVCSSLLQTHPANPHGSTCYLRMTSSVKSILPRIVEKVTCGPVNGEKLLGVGAFVALVVDPHKMRAAVQAQGIQVQDAAHAAERQALLMPAAADVFAAVRQQTPAALHRSTGWCLQGCEGDDGGHAISRAAVRRSRASPAIG
jgi:hypothetical protein